MDKGLSKKIAIAVMSIGLILGVCYVFLKPSPSILIGDGKNGPKGMVWIPGGTFVMGSTTPLAQPNEKPAHPVRIHGFWMDQTDVTNAQFAQFVKETRYITTAEKKPEWNTLKVQLKPGTIKPEDHALVPGAMVFVGTQKPVRLDNNAQWWRFVPGADWRHPQGPDSNIVGKDNHPVVQVSYMDAQAYAKWAGKQLPTEAQWEYAARGGLNESTYSWGDEFKPEGKSMANTFAGKQFPVVTAEYRDKIGTSDVKSYPPNGYQLYDMAGNVWQMVSDWYRSDAFKLLEKNTMPLNPEGPNASYDSEDQVPFAPKRVIRGGSFLCDANFCTSYRPSARRGIDPFNPMSHVGFRLVKSK
jgi:sulfatase modifying factor 1